MTTTTGYNANNCDAVSNFTDFLTCANQSGGDYTFTAILFLVTAVLTISLAGAFGWEVAILGSAFIGLVLSILFVYMGVMAWTTTGIFVGILIIMIMYIIWSNRYD